MAVGAHQPASSASLAAPASVAPSSSASSRGPAATLQRAATPTATPSASHRELRGRHQSSGAVVAAASDAASEGLSAVVDAVVSRGVDEFDDAALKIELADIEAAVRRLSARQTKIVGALTTRRATTIRHAGGTRATKRANDDIRRGLAEDLQWSPSKAKQTTQLGRCLQDTPDVAAAYDAGQLPARNATLLTDTLNKLAPTDRDTVRTELIDAARTQHAVAFGRTCRATLARIDHDTAMHHANRRHARRHAAITQTPDGMTVLTGHWAGVDAELLHTAIHAYTTPDTPGHHRTAEQRTADAVTQALHTALRHADAPAQHGIRPHITITIPSTTLANNHGTATAAWTGPLAYGEARHLIDDASITRILTDPAGLPLEVGKAVRTVPTGLYRLLVARDQGCIAQGCDTPAAWCDVMHTDTPYRKLGRLAPTNAALGCRTHHRLYDQHHWQLHWHNNRPHLTPPRARDP